MLTMIRLKAKTEHSAFNQTKNLGGFTYQLNLITRTWSQHRTAIKTWNSKGTPV
jgi:hypothetical protein